MIESGKELQRLIAEDAMKKIGEAGPCQCAKCRAKRAEFAA